MVDEAPGFEEFSVVRLTKPIRSDGTSYPAGTRGVIVHLHDDGIGSEVEFDDPPGAATVLAGEMAADEA